MSGHERIKMNQVQTFLALLPLKEEDFIEPLMNNYLKRCKHPNYENPSEERLICEHLRYQNLYRTLISIRNEQR